MNIIETISEILKGSLIIIVVFVTVGSIVEYVRDINETIGRKNKDETKKTDEWEDTHNEGSWN